jgi:hypothetical protein
VGESSEPVADGGPPRALAVPCAPSLPLRPLATVRGRRNGGRRAHRWLGPGPSSGRVQ